MKRKFIAIAFLALLLIGIAYVRALLSHQDREHALSPEVTRAIPAELIDDYIKRDEATRSFDSLRLFYVDSLEKLTSYRETVIDSQPREDIDSLQADISKLRDQVKQAEKNVEKAKRGKTEQFEKLIAAFYEGELTQLPSDLSKYERDVSIKEIKGKAQKYFGVSSKKLNTIIKKYK
jgi:non-ribosomal peptide synthetase component E (peptide arylation enzyme)